MVPEVPQLDSNSLTVAQIRAVFLKSRLQAERSASKAAMGARAHSSEDSPGHFKVSESLVAVKELISNFHNMGIY